MDPSSRTMAILGLGSIGAAFAELLVRSDVMPEQLVLIDTPNRQDHVARFAQRLRSLTDVPIAVESTLTGGVVPPDSASYSSSFLITAVSTPYAIDISRVPPGTILIDDSQPYCWSRTDAWERCVTEQDIAPCEAGLVDCSSIGYRSYFPFDFADEDASGCSHTSWSCLAEGLLLALQPTLPRTLGEPDVHTLELYNQAFDDLGFGVPALQCGKNKLRIADLKPVIGGQEWMVAWLGSCGSVSRHLFEMRHALGV